MILDKYAIEYAKTVPWQADEYIHVDGVPLVYTVDTKTNIVTVRYPGGVAVKSYTLRIAKHVVDMPTKLRTKQVVT